MEKDIFLIRHSEQLKIKDTKKYDISDQINNEKIILSVNGEILAREISELQVMQNINMVWSSNYVRALETAKYIAEKNRVSKPVVEQELLEIESGIPKQVINLPRVISFDEFKQKQVNMLLY